MTEAEARRWMDDRMPTAEGDRMRALRSRGVGMGATELMTEMQQLAGCYMSAQEIDTLTTEGAVVAWLTAATAP